MPQNYKNKNPQSECFKVYRITPYNRLKSFSILKGSKLVLTKVNIRTAKSRNLNLTLQLKLRSMKRKMRQNSKKVYNEESREISNNLMIQQKKNIRNLLMQS